MKFVDLDQHAIRETVQRLPDQFCTRDVSDAHHIMSSDAARPSFHARVGRFLNANAARLGICMVSKHGLRGARWAKLGAERSGVMDPSRDTAVCRTNTPPTTVLIPFDPGPQNRNDPPFRARMRFHQSHFRATRLQVPCGSGPGPKRHRLLGSMLTPRDGEAGLNLLTDEIRHVTAERLQESRRHIEQFRLMHNLLSSQPMCFNLFAPLVNNPERAKRFLRGLFPQIERVVRVRLEYAPTPRRDYLRDRTSLDVFIDYEQSDGARAFLAIETKLTDTFSRKLSRQPAYDRWMGVAAGDFEPYVKPDDASNACNQLWRNHLLAIAICHTAPPQYSGYRCVLIRHFSDSEGAEDAARYQDIVARGTDVFMQLKLDRVLSVFLAAATTHERESLELFRERYVDLTASEDAWQEFRHRR